MKQYLSAIGFVVFMLAVRYTVTHVGLAISRRRFRRRLERAINA